VSFLVYTVRESVVYRRPQGIRVDEQPQAVSVACLPLRREHDHLSPERLPDCFADHGAAPSIVELFTRWARQADATDTGQTEIRLDAEPSPKGRPYCRTTVNEAIRWLVAHRLLMRTKRGGGGHGSTYFVRWSFTDEGLEKRRRRVNRRKCVHPTQTQTGIDSPFSFARRNVEERKERKISSQNDASRRRPAPVIRLQTFSTSKPLRYCIAQARTEVNALPGVGKAVTEPLTDAIAAILHREYRAGRLRPGLRLGRFVAALCDRVSELPSLDLWDTALDEESRYRQGEQDAESDSDFRWRALSWAYWVIGETQTEGCAMSGGRTRPPALVVAQSRLALPAPRRTWLARHVVKSTGDSREPRSRTLDWKDA
jgi:hypothetical protein